MPTYHYKCENCNYEFEESQSIKDKPLRKCPTCKKLKLERVLYPCYGRIARSRNDMKTIGDLAKFNTDKLSKWEKESKDEEYAKSSRLAKAKLEKQKIEDPFAGHPIDKLAKATPEQKKRYIEKGEIPS